MIDAHSITDQAEQLLAQARTASTGRAATTLYGGTGHALRQTLVALVAGTELSEHENPGEATMHVLEGDVELRSGDSVADGPRGTLIAIPQARHALVARVDSVVLLSVAKSG